MSESKNPHVRDTYRANTVHQLTRLSERLSAMADDPQYTKETRELARIEADYVLDIALFRSLPMKIRRRLLDERRAPWLGTWTKKDLES